ncbi:hypothetical protein GOODEAATRI_015160 [Goodea atripinnis]|uniref:Uncharacterized protein n=1 Tax=Goodea atripinnis TaxID=208336 RepID=A0ABV0NUP9_9TELE
MPPTSWTPLPCTERRPRATTVSSSCFSSIVPQRTSRTRRAIQHCTHLACDEERVEAAKLLVEHGASIYIENKEEKTPLQIAKGGLGNLLRRIVEG